MSWREQYQPGSFRGAAFRTQSEERLGGRRVVSHEFPGRDDPVTEDLGARAKQFTLECHVIGAEFITARDALILALEDAGPGLLVHPQYGRMMAVVFEYSCSTSTDEGGLARFSITFGEAGQAVAAPATASTGNDSARVADTVIEQAPEDFADTFDIAKAASFVEDSAAQLVRGMGEAAKLSAGLRGGIGPTLRAFDASLNFLPGDLAGLLRAPLALGQSISGLVLAVSALAGGGRRTRLQSLEMMVDWQPNQEQFPIRTPQRVLEQSNRTALLQLFQAVSAAELTRAAATLDYASYDDAVSVRDSVAGRLDDLALAAADRGDDAAACTFDDLRRALARDIAARGASLARIYALRLQASEPALVLAHRLYGAETSRRVGNVVTLEARAAAIVARNRVAHPSFLPGGGMISLLTATARAGEVA